MQEYDFIMAGGGMAALSLARALVAAMPERARILIVDPETKGENDRTWCYWTTNPDPHAELVAHSWPTLRFTSHEWSHDFPLGERHYSMIRGEEFYRVVLDVLEAAPGVEFERGRVRSIDESGDSVTVTTDSRRVRAPWVFDSRFDPAEYASRSGAHHYLKQHFLGWTIETDAPLFDPQVVTFFDFRTPQHDEMRFVYVLPFTPRKALVEYTLFSAELLSDEEYREGLERYIREQIGANEFRVVERERGIIPMTDEPAPRRLGTRTLAIGTRGGRVKASTGFAFRRTQIDTEAIVTSLLDHGHPFAIPSPPRRFRMLDTMLLQVMYRRGALSERVFTSLFRRNPIDRMLRFLDEQTTFAETISIMATVPLPPFIAAFFRTQVLRKV